MRTPRSAPNGRLTRRTPCVGICSTTYGDLVCRGCKRFSHEVVGWNTYSEAQRQDVEERLTRLKAGVVRGLLTVRDGEQCTRALATDLARQIAPMPQEVAERPLELQVYDYLTRARTDVEAQALEPLAVEFAPHIETIAQLRSVVEAEFLSRSKAAYERSFKVSVE